MKSTLVYALIASLAAPSVSLAAQENAWWQIRASKPGHEVTLQTSSGPSRRYFIRADDDAITLLNVSNPDLPSDVAKLLRRSVAEHPENFPLPAGRTIALDAHATFSTSGVFVAGQKIAEYDQVVERIMRADVEGGAVSLVKPDWPASKQILVTLGAVVAVAASIVIIPCATKGCP